MVYFLIAVLLLYNDVLVSVLHSGVNQLYINTYPSPLSWTSLPSTPSNPPIKVIAEHQAKLPVPYSRMLLAICFIHGSLHMSVPTSQFIPIPSPPHVHTTISTSVSLFLPHKQVHLYHFSRFHIPVLIDDICFSLSEYFTLYNRYSRSVHISTSDPI